MSPCLMFHHWYEDWDPWMKGVAWPLRLKTHAVAMQALSDKYLQIPLE